MREGRRETFLPLETTRAARELILISALHACHDSEDLRFHPDSSSYALASQNYDPPPRPRRAQPVTSVISALRRCHDDEHSGTPTARSSVLPLPSCDHGGHDEDTTSLAGHTISARRAWYNDKHAYALSPTRTRTWVSAGRRVSGTGTETGRAGSACPPNTRRSAGGEIERKRKRGYRLSGTRADDTRWMEWWKRRTRPALLLRAQARLVAEEPVLSNPDTLGTRMLMYLRPPSSSRHSSTSTRTYCPASHRARPRPAASSRLAYRFKKSQRIIIESVHTPHSSPSQVRHPSRVLLPVDLHLIHWTLHPPIFTIASDIDPAAACCVLYEHGHGHYMCPDLGLRLAIAHRVGPRPGLLWSLRAHEDEQRVGLPRGPRRRATRAPTTTRGFDEIGSEACLFPPRSAATALAGSCWWDAVCGGKDGVYPCRVGTRAAMPCRLGRRRAWAQEEVGGRPRRKKRVVQVLTVKMHARAAATEAAATWS
ncbi:hypothetical protein C8R44DRAFT_381712 [Mycena epipterygia]|nr:hypothetical protein C8R44DRAFT_381712 [Mycena epipterygia]